MFIHPLPMYRKYRWLHQHRLRFFGSFVHFITRVIWSCDINPKAEIGAGTMLAHNGLGVVIGSNTKIGKRVVIYHHVTLGGPGRPDPRQPVIEDDVYIGAGAVLLGGITVGRGSVIGANSVVTKDIPPYSLVGGVPAKILRSNIDRSEYVAKG